MHFALLLGYGASAVNPYMGYAVLDELVKMVHYHLTMQRCREELYQAIGKGLLKIMSKMGISTMGSYRGAQLFEAIGLSESVVDKYFGVQHRLWRSSIGGYHTRCIAFPRSSIQW